ncbi:hypothetical protein PG997_008690 [Apiospora hydei]|uniref:Uncharacterized protein n=1 Tax=Apiospora hydei TaxID=1337664 RepID=A0ABR1WCY9_9PEZI
MPFPDGIPKILGNMPMEVQQMIWTEAIVSDHVDRVVPVLYGSNKIVLRSDITTLSKYFHLSPASRAAAQRVYDLQLPIVKDGKPGYVRLSSSLDIFFISAWGYTLGINAFSPLFQLSPTLSPPRGARQS